MDSNLSERILMRSSPAYSLVIPVYNNADSIGALVADITTLSEAFDHDFEAVYVIDGSPDDSAARLAELLTNLPYHCVVIEHARNFGSFAAIRTGLREATGASIAVRSADLQEPRTLIEGLLRAVSEGPHEVALGVRRGRHDSLHRRVGAHLFWSLYRRYVQPQMPRGGIDVFACSGRVRDNLLELREANSSLVGLLIWLGFPFAVVPYDRLPRAHGASQWSFRRLVDYMADSAFAFGRTPIRLIRWLGFVGIALGTLGAVLLLTLRLTNRISVSGYTPIMLAILIMGSLNLAAIGVIGSYVWRAFENTKLRQHAVVRSIETHGPRGGL